MKKIFLSTMMLTLFLVLTSCINDEGQKPNRPNPPSDEIVFNYNKKNEVYEASFTSMGTIIDLNFYQKDSKINDREIIANEILALFNLYHQLTDNFFGYEGINNVYYINENPNIKVPIVKELYDLLVLSEELRLYTEGYFDVSIGLIIDQWKELLSIRNATQSDLNKTLNIVDKIPVISNGILLEKTNDNYYVTIKTGVKLDLGAIAKGYVVDLANGIVKKAGFTYFTIRGSDSSVYYGQNPNKDRDYFRIGLSDPYFNYYGIIQVKDISVTTSGDDVQGANIGSFRVHHIISPKTKKPENLRHMMTIIDANAGIADALTTALFNMPEDVFINWIDKNPKAVIFYNADETSSSYNASNYLE